MRTTFYDFGYGYGIPVETLLSLLARVVTIEE
jgi:hypothetical protein